MKKASSCMVLALLMGNSYAGTMGPVVTADPSTYLSVFGGGGTVSGFSLAQLGTAFFTEAEGGPLAVNAYGHAPNRSVWMVGGNVGHYFANASMPFYSQWSFVPAAELEGYYIGKSTVQGNEVDNTTVRLLAHDFSVSYPTKIGVGLVNAVAYFNHDQFASWHPYVGGGVGMSVISISGAQSIQTNPSEPGVNHYNSGTSASTTAFASQAKAGLNYNVTPHLVVFGEYRYLYLAATDYLFGSTVVNSPAHVATSSWQAKFGSQSYNMGAGGIRYIF